MALKKSAETQTFLLRYSPAGVLRPQPSATSSTIMSTKPSAVPMAPAMPP